MYGMNWGFPGMFPGGIIPLIFIFLLFLLLREIWCWYWKINARLEAVRETNALLRDLSARMARLETAVRGQEPRTEDKTPEA